jgi:hypothetical protein
MSACGCPGCGGHGERRKQQAEQLVKNTADFEAWLAAGKPPVKEWLEARNDDAYADVAPEAVTA